jgi:predicted MFS family arabinose efflux permease
MTQAKIKRTLFLESALIIGAVLGFLWLLNINQAEELKRTFLLYVVVFWIFSVIALWLFYDKGVIFNSYGGLNHDRITTVIIIILAIVQVSFAFASYAYRAMNFSFLAFDHARDLYNSINWDEDMSLLSKQFDDISLPDEVDELYILDKTETVIYAKPVLPATGILPDYPQLDMYFFPLSDGTLVMHLSKSYQAAVSRRIMLDLFTVLVVSLFLGFELVLLVMRTLELKMFSSDKKTEHERRKGTRNTPDHCINFIRPMSFLFYFTSQLGTAFIPILVSQLVASAAGSNSIATGIPQSMELLFTCVSIFLASELIVKFGWKHSFLAGLVLVVAGTLLSAFAGSLVVFAASRGIVGLGYGFCWMTLRNISLFGKTDQENTWAYAMFLAGLYAGQNCGQVMGSILAETLGYRTVLAIAALATALSGFLVLSLKNDRLAAQNDDKPEIAQKSLAATRDIMQIVVFMALLMIPACITGSFTGYYLPLYITGQGRSVADVGRILLLYSLVLVYGGPKISELCQKYLGLSANIWYNIVLASSFLFFGFTGGFAAIAISTVMLALADGFGGQKDAFLTLRLVSRMPRSRGLSLYSFLMKLMAMLGPLVFELTLSRGSQGMLALGLSFLVMTVFAVLFLRRLERT